MPILQAYPNDQEIMKYKLVTLPRGTAKLPIIDIGYNSIALRQGASLSITPQTLNYLGATSTYEPSGYVATIGTNVSKTVIGTTINLSATTLNTLFGINSTLYTTLVIVGRDSGARISVPVNITKVTQ
jgi:hypothetical protein